MPSQKKRSASKSPKSGSALGHVLSERVSWFTVLLDVVVFLAMFLVFAPGILFNISTLSYGYSQRSNVMDAVYAGGIIVVGVMLYVSLITGLGDNRYMSAW